MDNKTILLFGVIALALIIIAGAAFVEFFQKPSDSPSYSAPSPESIVTQYFESWNKKTWPDMYAAISDGFKKIDPNAKNLAAFGNFAGSQGITGVNLLSVNETSNDGATASVDYSVEFLLSNGDKKKLDDTFTLKYRPGDIIPGWKLIHPFGPNIDTS